MALMPSRRHRGAQRDLERVGWERVLQSLVDEGFAVTEVWSPEDVPADPRVAGRSTRPDCAFLLDGREAAIDVTEFWTTQRGAAGTFAAAIRRDLVARLETAALPFDTLGLVVYHPAALAERRSGDRATDAAVIAEAMLEVARRGPAESIQVADDRLPAWVKSAGLTTSLATTEHRLGRASIHAMPARDPAAHVAEVLDQVAGTKGAQLAAWGAAIVSVIHNIDVRADDVRAGLEVRNDWPWWRLYWVHPGDVELLWDRGDHRPDPTPAGGR